MEWARSVNANYVDGNSIPHLDVNINLTEDKGTTKAPAKGKTGNVSKRHNHFSKVCRSSLKREYVQEVKTKEDVVSTKTPKVNAT